MDYLSIHEDDTSISSDKTDRAYNRWARKRSSIRMFYDESALGDRKTNGFYPQRDALFAINSVLAFNFMWRIFFPCETCATQGIKR
ncbi:hypothetical protein Q1695_012306 [Nippostrongylus brasiliensis]|nr:hypothetical protein Q1695_012306 [Nippostrongylus brasiliensis]